MKDALIQTLDPSMKVLDGKVIERNSYGSHGCSVWIIFILTYAFLCGCIELFASTLQEHVKGSGSGSGWQT